MAETILIKFGTGEFYKKIMKPFKFLLTLEKNDNLLTLRRIQCVLVLSSSEQVAEYLMGLGD